MAECSASCGAAVVSVAKKERWMLRGRRAHALLGGGDAAMVADGVTAQTPAAVLISEELMMILGGIEGGRALRAVACWSLLVTLVIAQDVSVSRAIISM